MPKATDSRTIHIKSGQGDYQVHFSDSVQALVGNFLGRNGHVLVVVDSNVAKRYEAALAPLLNRFETCLAPATEEEKTLAGVERALQFFQGNNATKQTTILAIGGGIIQDIVTFACHLYYRGIQWVFVPTTLLSQCDSCIGAKCGINFNAFKNQLGVFHAPSSIWICPAFLKTLPDSDIASGYGEILKLVLLGSPEAYQRLVKTVDREGFRNAQIDDFIYESLRIKKDVIEEDEYETDRRRILNYGHTFGHALEAITHHAIPHGTGVAFGVDIANRIAWESGMMGREEYENIHAFVERHFSCKLAHPVSAQSLIDGTRRDKKILNGRLVLVTIATAGKPHISPFQFDELLHAQVTQYLKDSHVLYWD